MNCDYSAAESAADNGQAVFIGAAIADTVQRRLDACSDLIVVISHDLRTPLNTLIMASSSISNLLAAEPAYAREAAIIRRAADQMLRLVSDLFDVSLLQVGRLRVVPRHCTVDDLRETDRRLFRTACPRKEGPLACESASKPDDFCGSRTHGPGPIESRYKRNQVHSGRRLRHGNGRSTWYVRAIWNS